MADSYQAQVQAAWQKSWNQTQSLLQNLRFRERGPLKSWRPETMAEAIHAVLKEGLSLSQAARKYDIPYPTFVLYANRVHNLLGPSHEPGDMRPKGRGRPQRILLGAWPEDQIKGVIRAVVFRDTTVFRDGDHKENKKPATPQIKDESVAPIGTAPQTTSNGPITPNSASLTPNGTPDKSGNSTPIPPSTPSTSQPLLPGVHGTPRLTPPVPGVTIPLPSPLSKEVSRTSDNPLTENGAPTTSSSSPCSVSPATISGAQSITTSTSSIPSCPNTPQSRPSSVTSNGPANGAHQNGPSNAISTSSGNGQSNGAAATVNGMIAPNLPSPSSSSGTQNIVPSCSQAQSPVGQQAKTPQISPPVQQQFKGQQQPSQHSHFNHQQSALFNNSHLHQRNPHYPHHNHQHPARHQQNPIGPMGGPQQMLGLIAGGLSPPSLANPSAHMARLFGEGPPQMHTRPPQPPINAFHPGFPRPAHPSMQPIPMSNLMNNMGTRMNMEDQEPSPEAILFGKVTSSDRQIFSQISPEVSGGRQVASNPFDGSADTTTTTIERPMMFRDPLDTIKSEPEAIMN